MARNMEVSFCPKGIFRFPMDPYQIPYESEDALWAKAYSHISYHLLF